MKNVWPILEKVRPISATNSSGQFFFLRSLLSFLAGISATWQHWLLPSHPPPHFPLSLPPLPLTPPIPSSPPTDCSISQIWKDDYHLPFCEIIIFWSKCCWIFQKKWSKGKSGAMVNTYCLDWSFAHLHYLQIFRKNFFEITLARKKERGMFHQMKTMCERRFPVSELGPQPSIWRNSYIKNLPV